MHLYHDPLNRVLLKQLKFFFLLIKKIPFFYKEIKKNKPSGSTSLANLTASDVEKSTLAGVIARIIAFGFEI